MNRRRTPMAKAKRKRDEEIEERIMMEIVVDA